MVYLIFNEGYAASGRLQLTRAELCTEAIRVGRPLVELLPDKPEGIGLLALMLLAESRRAAPARASPAAVQQVDLIDRHVHVRQNHGTTSARTVVELEAAVGLRPNRWRRARIAGGHAPPPHIRPPSRQR